MPQVMQHPQQFLDATCPECQRPMGEHRIAVDAPVYAPPYILARETSWVEENATRRSAASAARKRPATRREYHIELLGTYHSHREGLEALAEHGTAFEPPVIPRRVPRPGYSIPDRGREARDVQSCVMLAHGWGGIMLAAHRSRQEVSVETLGEWVQLVGVVADVRYDESQEFPCSFNRRVIEFVIWPACGDEEIVVTPSELVQVRVLS